MALPRYAWRPKLFSPCPNSIRFASSAGKQRIHGRDNSDRREARQGTSSMRGAGQAGSRQAAAPKQKTVGAILPESMGQYVRNKTLSTTQQNIDFMKKYNLEWNTGTGFKFDASRELQSLLGPSLQAAWSPRHVISPFHLQFFVPRGHPLAPLIRHRYACAALQKALWIYVIPLSGSKPVVRFTVRSKLKKAILDALEGMGYTHGVGATREIRGTLWICDRDSVKSANLPIARVGSLIAQELVEKYSQPIAA